MSEQDWARQRREAAEAHADMLERRRQAEHDHAARLLREFAAVARDRLPAERLHVRGYGGKGSARSDVTGWYLRADRAAGMSTDGEFYVLTAPLGLRDRLTGVTLRPTPPPLVLGAGGKDGESLDLPVALERLLPGWRDAQDTAPNA
ncbi:hypothetical protein FHE66_10880 [Georgenia sp. 311]|uniref:hypothetical protein n=1 Tax=Georgenia sp. 311 TaxID=2585134 RepID=UPI0011122266|nr:hypothetical protein [Georgenia sp. 311]TNC17369.1 hypothetical protein FHE66_10880 [Georgenia sp. 311]